MSTPPASERLREEAIDWLLRLREPDCSSAERQAFEHWLARSSTHRALYEKLACEWDRFDRFRNLDFPVRQTALSYCPAKKHFGNKALGWAACMLLAVGLATFAISPDGWYGVSHTYLTPVGGSQHVVLEDGTAVELNTDSEITVRLNRWQRSVELMHGEAYFKVVHDERRPFVVHAGQGRVVDVGTSFDVYRQANQITVAVDEGVVRIDAKTSAALKAFQSIAYDAEGTLLPRFNTPVDTLTSWRKGRLVFENRRLDEVLAEFARYHTTRIRLGTPSLANLRVSGSFHLSRLDSALETIALTLPVVPHHLNATEIVLNPR